MVMVGPRRWKAAMVSYGRKWAHRRGNGGTWREFLVILPQSGCLRQILSTRSGGQKLVTMPTFFSRTQEILTRAGAQKCLSYALIFWVNIRIPAPTKLPEIGILSSTLAFRV